MDSSLIFISELDSVEVCRNNGMKSSVLPCVYEVIKTGDRKLIYKLGSEIIYYKKIALHIFLALGVALTVSASETVILKGAYNVL